MEWYVGIDVGGTNLKAGLVDERGNIQAVERTPLGEFQGNEWFVRQAASLASAVAKKGGVHPSDIRHVGMGLPGAVDGGTIVFITNIPMRDVPIADLFRQYLDCPLLLGNDADCAAVGELFQGAGRGLQDLAVVTLGTGVGVGLILGGKLRGGPCSSEGGHMTIQHGGGACNCGRHGCWEYYASATGLIRLTKEAMARHPESVLHQLAQKSGVEGRTAFQAAEDGDETALTVCRQYVDYVADGLISLINLLRPEAVAIGGGVAAAPEYLLLHPLQEIVARESYAHHGGAVTRIVPAKLGNDAGIIGAALLHKV